MVDCRLLIPGLVSDALANGSWGYPGGTPPLVDRVESAHYGEMETNYYVSIFCG